MSKRSFKGFAVPGKIYKLKTMATNRKKPIVFHAEALADKSRQLLLEGQESISILPFDCDETFINVTVTDAGPTERTGKFVFGYVLGESSGCRKLFPGLLLGVFSFNVLLFRSTRCSNSIDIRRLRNLLNTSNKRRKTRGSQSERNELANIRQSRFRHWVSGDTYVKRANGDCSTLTSSWLTLIAVN